RRRRQRQGAARQLLGEEAVRHHVGVGAAIALGVAQAEPALRAEALEELAWELAALVERVRLRRHLGVHEARHRAAELFLLGRERDHGRPVGGEPTRVPLEPLRLARSTAVARASICSPTITTPYASRAISIDT